MKGIRTMELHSEMAKLLELGKEKVDEFNDFIDTMQLTDYEKMMVRGEISFNMGVMLGRVSKVIHEYRDREGKL